MIPDDELARLNATESPSEMEARGVVLLGLSALCPSGAAQVVDRTREVLCVVVVASTGAGWPSLEEWRGLLPRWFVDACGHQRSKDEEMRWLQRWRSASPAEKAHLEREQPWSLADWVHWFRPGERQWRWWSWRVAGDVAVVQVAADQDPCPLAALVWLLRAAGATEVNEITGA